MTIIRAVATIIAVLVVLIAVNVTPIAIVLQTPIIITNSDHPEYISQQQPSLSATQSFIDILCDTLPTSDLYLLLPSDITVDPHDLVPPTCRPRPQSDSEATDSVSRVAFIADIHEIARQHAKTATSTIHTTYINATDILTNYGRPVEPYLLMRAMATGTSPLAAADDSESSSQSVVVRSVDTDDLFPSIVSNIASFIEESILLGAGIVTVDILVNPAAVAAGYGTKNKLLFQHTPQHDHDSIRAYHTDNGCNLWWPLNNTELFVFSLDTISNHDYDTSSRTLLTITEPIIFGRSTINLHQLSFTESIEITLMVVLYVSDEQSNAMRRKLTFTLPIPPQSTQGEAEAGRHGSFGPLSVPWPLHITSDMAQARGFTMKISVTGSAAGHVISMSSFTIRKTLVSQAIEPVNRSVDSFCLRANASSLDLVMINNIRTRDELGFVLPHLLAPSDTPNIMVEVGINEGLFSQRMLDTWPGCQRYLLVDPWHPVTADHADYIDSNNFHSDRIRYQQHYASTHRRLAGLHGKKSIVMRMTSEQAARRLRNESIAVVYIDARHDYHSVIYDMDLWWPKLIPGGVLAGHDFYLGYNYETVFTVKPAVEKWARDQKRLLHHTNDEQLPSWFLFK